ncbi:hypothetical protein [Bacillus weihaiensis]|uniref:hypothetical protein n=1 Tax=Bacillus weihaiensis TaxID=1547283 RepID=UPI002357FE46|nr:hypothetical protein [Bacillus weihaiensis]
MEVKWVLSKQEITLIEEIKQGLDSDLPMMSFGTSKSFSEEFPKENKGISFKDAPFKEPLVVVSDRLSTFYYEHGVAGCAMGSIIVKDSESHVSFIDAHDFLLIHGFRTKDKIVGKYQVKTDVKGEVIRLKEVKIPNLY